MNQTPRTPAGWFVFVSLAMIGALLMAACQAAPATAPTSAATGAAAPTESAAPVATQPPSATAGAAEPVTLVVFSEEQDDAIILPLFEEFESQNPGLEIELIEVSHFDFLPNLQARTQGEGQIDVLGVNGDAFVDMVRFGLLMDLTDQTLLWDRVHPNYWSYWELDGRRYTVPACCVDMWGWWYNQKLFDKYGLEVPETFQELEEVSQVFLENGVIPRAHPGRCPVCWINITGQAFLDQFAGNDANTLMRNIVQGSGSFSDPAWKGTIEAGLALVDLERGISGTSADEMMALDESGVLNLFYNGQTPMILFGTWILPDIAAARAANPDVFDPHFMASPLATDVSSVPIPPGTKRTVQVFPAGGFGVSAATEHPELAIKLIDFLSTPASAEKWLQAYETPLTYVVGATGPSDDPLWDELLVHLENDPYTAPDWQMGKELVDLHAELFAKVMQGEITVDEMLQQMDERMAAIRQSQ